MKRRSNGFKPKMDLGDVLVWRTSSQIIGLEIVTGHGGINKSLNFLVQKFRRPINLKDLVEVSGMSRRGFCKTFNKEVGLNPGEFLRKIRIEYAKWLMVEYDLELRQVARQCGFRSMNTFCVAFQRMVGMPPKQKAKAILAGYLPERTKNQIHPEVPNRLVTPVVDEKAGAIWRFNTRLRRSPASHNFL